MMTENDYIIIARALADVREQFPDGICTVDVVEDKLVKRFAGNDARFNWTKFRDTARRRV